MSGLTMRDYRWTWAALAASCLVLAALIVPLLVLYPLALLTVRTADGIGNLLGSLSVRAYNRDLARRDGCARRAGEARPDGWLPGGDR